MNAQKEIREKSWIEFNIKQRPKDVDCEWVKLEDINEVISSALAEAEKEIDYLIRDKYEASKAKSILRAKFGEAKS